MVCTSPFLRQASLVAGATAALGLLTACGGQDLHSTPQPQHVSGSPAPATDDSTNNTTASPSAPASAGGGTSSSAKTAGTAGTTRGSGTSTGTTGTRCHTPELAASVGRNNPGAGQENFPVVLTNRSARTCSVRGYPGAAFVNASGTQLGPDPKRSSGTPATVTLKPGQSAWAGLTFSNPEISGAKTATPAALLVTPPDERDHLKVEWTAGEVPVSGNASSVFLTVFRPGTGA